MANGSFQFSTQLALDGSADKVHTVAFSGTDKAGNVSSPVSFSFTLDTIAPTVTITSPASGLPTNSNPTIAGTVTDASSGVASLQARVDGGAAQAVALVNGSFQFATQLTLDGSADKVHTVAFTATDKAGNVSSPVNFSFTLDTIAPTVTITSPASGLTTNSNPTIAGALTDAGSGVASLQAAVDGGAAQAVALVNGTFLFSTQLALNGTTDSRHTVTFEAIDKAGNASSPVAYSFTLDTRAPAVTITSPTTALTTNSNVTIAGTATDNGSGVARSRRRWTAAWRKLSRWPTAASSSPRRLTLQGSADKTHTVAFTATDKAGNVSSPVAYNFMLDTVPPVIAVAKPDDGR